MTAPPTRHVSPRRGSYFAGTLGFGFGHVEHQVLKSKVQWAVRCTCLELGDSRQGYGYTFGIYWGGRGSEGSGGGPPGDARRICVCND